MILISPLNGFDAKEGSPDTIQLEGAGEIIKLEGHGSFLQRRGAGSDQRLSEEDKREIFSTEWAYLAVVNPPSKGEKNWAVSVLEEHKRKINLLLGALRVVKKTRTHTQIIFILDRKEDEYSIIQRLLTDKPKRLPARKGSFSRKDLEQVQKVFKAVKGLAVTHRLRNSFAFFDTALTEKTAEVAFILFVTCLESLVNTSNVDVAYQFRLRLSFLLGTDERTRRSIFESAKKIYEIRSNIVHGSEYKAEDAIKNLPQLEKYCREALNDCFFNKQLFKNIGRKKSARSYFDELVLSN